MSSRTISWSLVTGVVFVLVLAIPACFTTAGVYVGYVGAIQTLGVLLALVVAVATLRSDSRDRRVDRVLSFHREFTTGEVGEARSRLGQLIKGRMVDGEIAQSDIRNDLSLNTYGDVSRTATPVHDRNLLLRYFERVWIAHDRGSLDDLMLTALVGRHATWWDRALPQETTTARVPLARLAEWSNRYAEANAREPSLEGWGQTRRADFGDHP